MTINEHEDARAANIALAAAEKAVLMYSNELWGRVGYNVSTHEGREDLRADLAFVRGLRTDKDFMNDVEFSRTLRKGSARAGMAFVISLVTVLTGGFAIGMWEGFKVMMGR